MTAADLARLLADLRAEVRSIRAELIAPARYHLASAAHWYQLTKAGLS